MSTVDLQFNNYYMELALPIKASGTVMTANVFSFNKGLNHVL